MPNALLQMQQKNLPQFEATRNMGDNLLGNQNF